MSRSGSKPGRDVVSAKSKSAKNETSQKRLAVVGIGASAGGLETFKELLGALPGDTGMAFVLVQHLDPHHGSMLPELLVSGAAMPVLEAVNDMALEPDHVYVIPSNADLAVLHDRLYLMPRPQRHGVHLPIDYFFRSLAADCADRAIGVVLSGTGSDGAKGLTVIKKEGGITFVQDPATAQYDGMPRAAMAAGGADFVLPAPGIAEELSRIARRPTQVIDADVTIVGGEDVLKKLFILVRDATGVDFTHYKRGTIQRRVARRMLLRAVHTTEEYVRYLERHPEEIRYLYSDLLITVTEFFREPDTFEALKRDVFPKIVAGLSQDEAFRVWVPGCSTGEEAYSIAICLFEFLERVGDQRPVHVFGTDINEKSVVKARIGIYEEEETSGISPDRLKRFFVAHPGGYQINKLIREACVFARHDVVKDPPFSRLSLISCRNVLIYLGPVLQKRVLSTFHYALNPGGCLLLGSSETIGEFTNLFKPINQKHKIYFRKAEPARLFVESPSPAEPQVDRKALAKAPLPPGADQKFDLKREADRLVLERHAPAGVIVDDDMMIMQVRGRTGLYLEPAPGKASLSVIDMARPGLGLELRAAIYRAAKTMTPVSKGGVKVKHDGSFIDVSIAVTPIEAPAGKKFYLVLFNHAPASRGRGVSSGLPKGKRAEVEQRENARLRKELADTKEYIQATLEERDSTTEELRAANEEVQSSNEELQSLNEELETAKEELQSSNEELTTLNEELQNRNAELMRLNDALETTQRETESARRYAQGIVETIREPLLVLDGELKIISANPAFYETFKVSRLEAEDNPIYEMGNGEWDIPRLRRLLRSVASKHSGFQGFRVDHHFSRIGRRTMLLNARPILGGAKSAEMILLAIEDITARYEVEERLRSSEERYRAIADTATDAVISLDADNKIILWNRAAESVFGYSNRQALGRDIDIIVPERYRKRHRRGMARFLATGEGRIIGKTVELEALREDGSEVPIELSVANWNTDEGAFFTGIARDITERRRADERRSRRRLYNESLNRISTTIGQLLDVEDILRTVALQGGKALGTESALVLVLQAGRMVVSQAYGLPQRIVGKVLTDDQTQSVARAAGSGEPIVINDVRSDDRVKDADAKRYKFRSLLVAPLGMRKEVLGAVVFGCHSAGTVFSEDAVEFAKKLGAYTAMAVENAELYAREHHIAETLQEALLVMPEELEGLTFGHLYESATAEPARVGGDFYDLFEIKGDRVGVIIGDVSGKGLEASRLTSLVKDTIKAHAYQGDPPGWVMSKTNSVMCRLLEDTFVTIFFGILDKKTGSLVYCCAGHPPPLVRRPRSRISSLRANSPAVGLLADFSFAESTVALKPRDILVGFTDGVTDARRGRMFFGERRLAKAIRDKEITTAADMPAAILGAVKAFARGRLADDVAILALSLEPSAVPED